MEVFAELPQITLPASPVPFCAFCLRANSPNVEFYKHVVGSTTELRNSLQSMLGFDFQLANFSICKPCWKLMQLVQDFRLRCFKANMLVERIGQGIQSEDGWFSMKNLAIIESVRMMIKDQVQQIGIEEELRATDVPDNQNLDQDMEGELVSTIECNLCDEKLFTEERLAEHYDLVHPNQKKYPCKLCSTEFSNEPCLKTHMQTKHGATGPKTFPCPICGKQFTVKYNIRPHIEKVHGGERNFQCEICKKRLTNRSCLQAHVARFHPESASENAREILNRRQARMRELTRRFFVRFPYK
ncbi:zinc finger and BTB domain-containing protein 47-like [Culex pipiens pallens]|uniref:zinc finger and BTB domain-containing protein 47-like n=1 Tax=Culex pipiens pallens TaxID=42434 RepID=UPI0019547675|nr:zinc finger and BTB domain-containing protein 47-like [Culex pipiens pallens]